MPPTKLQSNAVLHERQSSRSPDYRRSSPEACAAGAFPTADPSSVSLTSSVRAARNTLDAIRRGEDVPSTPAPGSATSIIAEWQKSQSLTVATKAGDLSDPIAAWQAKQDKSADIAKIVAEHGSGNFKSQVKRGVEALMAPSKGGAQVVMLMHRSGLRD